MNQPQNPNRVRTVAIKPRKTGVAYAIFFLTAMIGIHMFYLRQPLLAVSKILTLNWFFVGIVIDAILMPRYVRRANSPVK